MNVISSISRNEIAKRAYFYFLERKRQGLPDNPQEDWTNAETDLVEGRNTDTGNGSFSTEVVPLSRIKGIGPRVTASLIECGVTDANTLATWTLQDFGERLPRLTVRARNGEWIEQAKTLTKQ